MSSPNTKDLPNVYLSNQLLRTHSSKRVMLLGEDPLSDSECDLDSVAGVLKLYFRGLEPPLFPYDSYSQLLDCGRKNPFRHHFTGFCSQVRQLFIYLVMHNTLVSYPCNTSAEWCHRHQGITCFHLWNNLLTRISFRLRSDMRQAFIIAPLPLLVVSPQFPALTEALMGWLDSFSYYTHSPQIGSLCM